MNVRKVVWLWLGGEVPGEALRFQSPKMILKMMMWCRLDSLLSDNRRYLLLEKKLLNGTGVLKLGPIGLRFPGN